jgi:hypothetical protein
VSQSDVLMFLHKHVDELGPLADVTLQQLGLATKPVVCVPAEMSTIKAFASMVVSCSRKLTEGCAGHQLYRVEGNKGVCLMCHQVALCKVNGMFVQ